jgi:hypothetical protein
VTRPRHPLWSPLLAAVLVGVVSQSAPAQEATQPAEATPLPLPPPPPPRKRAKAAPPPERAPSPPPALETPTTVHVHDGFYFRVALGPHYGRTSVDTDRTSQPDVRMRGVGWHFSLWVGGTPKPGLVIGGVIGGRAEDSDEGTVGDRRASTDASASRGGIFIDAYPVPEEGFHFGGILSGSSTEVESAASGDQPSTSYRGEGVGVSVFAGLDTWIGEQWSFGALVELGGNVSRDDAKIDGQDVLRQSTSYFAAAQVTVVYH